jgi:tRNA 2-thiouridine synthesizing protein A
MTNGNSASEAPVPSVDAVLEMMGLSEEDGTGCARLTPAVKAKLRDMQSGQVLEIRVDDPIAREDIASWCRITGHTLLAVTEAPPQTLHFYVRRKQA